MYSDLANLSLETESQIDSLCTLIHLHFLQLLRDGECGATDFSSGCIKSYKLAWRARHYVIPAQPARESEREGERRRTLLSHQPPPLQSCHILDFTVKPLKREENLTWPSLSPAVFNVEAINADTSAVQRICLLACLRVYVCMGVNGRKRGEEEEVSTLRASEN